MEEMEEMKVRIMAKIKGEIGIMSGQLFWNASK